MLHRCGDSDRSTVADTGPEADNRRTAGDADAAVEIGFPPPGRFDDGYAPWAGYDRPVSLALTMALPQGATTPARPHRTSTATSADGPPRVLAASASGAPASTNGASVRPTTTGTSGACIWSPAR